MSQILLFEKPFINNNNIIKSKDGYFGIKDLDLLSKNIDESEFCKKIENKQSIKPTNIFWFKKKYQNIQPLDIFLKKIKNENLDLTQYTEMLVQDISRQIKYLESIGRTLVSLNINDIIVINDIYFLFVNEFKVCNICSESNYAVVYMPIPTSDYIAPEIISNKLILPMKFHRSSCYWSLAALALDILFNYKIDINYDSSNLYRLIKSLSFSPLHQFILRCINVEVNDRSLIII
jgi:hypothetical protein